MHAENEATRIDRELRAIATQRQQLLAREAHLLVQAEDLEIWRDHGCATFLEYLERFCDLSPRTAKEHIRVARALTALPLMRADFDAQRIVYSTARELTRIATPETEAKWLRHVAGMSPREVEEAVSGHEHGDDPSDPKDPDHKVKLVLEVRESTYAQFMEARTRYVEEHGGEYPTDDELVRYFCRPASSDAAATADAAPYRLAISTCRTCAKSFQIAGGREVEVPSTMVDMFRCDARHLGDLEADVPARALASVTPRMREQVLARDGFQCRVPGCRSRRNLDVHHIEFQCMGGPNKGSNLATLCGGHHAQLHEGLLTISGTAPHAIVFTWPLEPERTSTRDRPSRPLGTNTVRT